jgi:hypothetical protein
MSTNTHTTIDGSRRIDNKTVEGAGLRISVLDIHTVAYMEESWRAQVEIEGGVEEGNINWIIYATTLSGWNVDGGRHSMTKEERNLVLTRISAALTLLDMPNRIAW